MCRRGDSLAKTVVLAALSTAPLLVLGYLYLPRRQHGATIARNIVSSLRERIARCLGSMFLLALASAHMMHSQASPRKLHGDDQCHAICQAVLMMLHDLGILICWKLSPSGSSSPHTAHCDSSRAQSMPGEQAHPACSTAIPSS